jgi:nucleoside-diphosphate-sugar epimerase
MSLVLVTGATGFIGRHLCFFLDSRGYKVRGVFRHAAWLTTLPAEIEGRKIEDIGKITDSDWSTLLEGVDYVIHLAALAHQLGPQASRSREEFMTINAVATQRLAEAVVASNTVKRLVYVSSVAAVKSFSEEAINEATPAQPEDDYGRSKRAAELAIEKVLDNTRPDWCIVRPPLVYGPGNPGNMARLIKLIKLGIPLPLGGINNRRSFLYVGNLVDALERCLWHPGASRRLFLLGDGEPLSTPELVRQLAGHLDKPIKMLSLPPGVLKVFGKIGDLMSCLLGRSIGLDSYSVQRLLGSMVVDSSALRQAIGWQPSFTLEEGIVQTFQEKRFGGD